MSHDKNDESFDPLPHEKNISEIYQGNNKHRAELPSEQIDTKIMVLAQEQIHKQSPAINKITNIKRLKTWQWPLSMAASIGILGVLFITQTEYFIQPNNINSNDAGILQAPVMRASDSHFAKVDETLAEQKQTEENVQVAQKTASATKTATLSGNEFPAQARKSLSISGSSSMLQEQMLDKSMLEDNSAKISPMSLYEMSKLAELLKLELAIQNMSKLESNASLAQMQKTLFEHLIQYQKTHPEYTITEKYLSVLTEQQAQQLTALGIKAVPEN